MSDIYFVFKGVSSKTMGLSVQTMNEPLTAAVKKIKHDPPFMDGSLDFSALAGEKFYENKVIEYTLRFVCSGMTEFNAKLDTLAGWLTGRGSFTSCRGKTYDYAEVYGSISAAPQMFGHYGEINVVFEVPPFAVGESKPST